MRPGLIAPVLALLPGCFTHTVEEIEAPPRYSTATHLIPTESPLFSLEITGISAESIRLRVTRQARCEETTLAVVDRKESSARRPAWAVYALAGAFSVLGVVLVREENEQATGALAVAAGAGLFVSHVLFSKTTERELPSHTTAVLRTPTTCQPGLAPGVVVRARSGDFVAEGQADAQGEVLLRLTLTDAPLFFVQGDAVTPSGLRLPPPAIPQARPSSAPSTAPPRQRPGSGDLW